MGRSSAVLDLPAILHVRSREAAVAEAVSAGNFPYV